MTLLSCWWFVRQRATPGKANIYARNNQLFSSYHFRWTLYCAPVPAEPFRCSSCRPHWPASPTATQRRAGTDPCRHSANNDVIRLSLSWQQWRDAKNLTCSLGLLYKSSYMYWLDYAAEHVTDTYFYCLGERMTKNVYTHMYMYVYLQLKLPSVAQSFGLHA